ncbi:MAG: alpha/beta hydrolase family protein [Armatimonadota bacterium]
MLRGIVACLVATAVVPGVGAAPAPPQQPAEGPGGADYKHAGVTESSYGSGGSRYWLFEPSGPAPETAPLIVFNHGWMGIDPRFYQAWIEHLVKRGNIVVFPQYQRGALTLPQAFTPLATAATKDAIRRLQGGGHVRPDLEKFAIVGHSAGGAITANMAARAALDGLPTPKAIMPVEPGTGAERGRGWTVPLEDFGKIPQGCLLLVVVGADDKLAGDVSAKHIFRGATQVPAEDKDFVVVNTDRHGRPRLVADHFAPCGGPETKRTRVDALDYYAFWKLFDALTDAAFYGENREVALGNTPEQRYMGVWSDGQPVVELTVTDDP